jgi:hypothetical protein
MHMQETRCAADRSVVVTNCALCLTPKRRSMLALSSCKWHLLSIVALPVVFLSFASTCLLLCLLTLLGSRALRGDTENLLRCKQPPLARPSSCMLNLDTSSCRDQLDSAVQPLAVSELPATVERQQHTACTHVGLCEIRDSLHWGTGIQTSWTGWHEQSQGEW